MSTDKHYLWHTAEAVEWYGREYYGNGTGYYINSFCNNGAGGDYVYIESRIMDLEIYRVGYVY